MCNGVYKSTPSEKFHFSNSPLPPLDSLFYVAIVYILINVFLNCCALLSQFLLSLLLLRIILNSFTSLYFLSHRVTVLPSVKLFSLLIRFFFSFSLASIPSLLFFSLLVLACFKPNWKAKKKKKIVTDACAAASTTARHVRAYRTWVRQPTELLRFGKCGMVAICVTFLQSTQMQHH